MSKKKSAVKEKYVTPTTKVDKVVLNMSFAEAMKKALNTPLPKKQKS